jgi:diguanylate cyclase (GGDEF)-like protein
MSEEKPQEPQEPASASQDLFRGAQQDLVFRVSGLLSILGPGLSLALMAFYPPTVAIGAVGWALVVPPSLLTIVMGVLSATLRRRPSLASVDASAFVAIAQISLLEWLAGGGKAPYLQMLIVPLLGSSIGMPARRCGQVAFVASLAAFSPLLYGSSVDVARTVTEFTLLSSLTVLIAIVVSSTREHRARLQDAGEHANVLAHVDPLTGMPNRRAFDEALMNVMESSQRDGTPTSLVLCDVNSFKQVNDQFGHAAGDEVLQSIAQALSDSVRGPDMAFRWAGDEFAVILGASDELGASRVAARIRDAVKRQCKHPDGTVLTIGTGVAELKPGMSAEEVLIEADRALFAHKAQQSQLVGVAAEASARRAADTLV